MKQNNRALPALHLSVLLFGLSGLFAKWVDLPSLTIVFGRVLFSSLFLFALHKIGKRTLRPPTSRRLVQLLAAGFLLGVHWWSFYEAIQRTTVALGLLTFSSFPIFTVFLEPIFFREKIRGQNLIFALLTFGGILLVLPLNQGGVELTGALLGVFSGFLYALLCTMNRHFAKDCEAGLTAFWEQSAAAVFLLTPALLLRAVPTPRDVLLLLLLGVFFTGLAHTLFIRSLKDIPAQTAGIISSLEPVYGAVFAALFLGERLSVRELVGGGIILLVTILSSFKASKNKYEK